MNLELSDFKSKAGQYQREGLVKRKLNENSFKSIGKVVVPVLSNNEIKVAEEIINKNHKL